MLRQAIYIALFLTLAPQLSNASDWQYAATSNSKKTAVPGHVTKATTTIDVQSILRAERILPPTKLIKAWFKDTYSEDMFHQINEHVRSKPFRIETELMYFSCDERKWAIPVSIYYDVKGGVVDSYSQDFSVVAFQDTVPDSFGEQLLNKTCELAAKKGLTK